MSWPEAIATSVFCVCMFGTLALAIWKGDDL